MLLKPDAHILTKKKRFQSYSHDLHINMCLCLDYMFHYKCVIFVSVIWCINGKFEDTGDKIWLSY